MPESLFLFGVQFVQPLYNFATSLAVATSLFTPQNNPPSNQRSKHLAS